MLTVPMDVLTQFPVRKSKKQKQAFRDAVASYVQAQGYSCTVEQGSGAKNLVIGDSEQASFLVTAHYDTCARMLLPNFITPCNLVAYLIYQICIVALLVVLAGLAGGLSAVFLEADPGVIALAVYWVLLILLLAGPANPSNANDNTSGVVAVLEILRTLPESQRSKVCFILFDLEEAGLVGSSLHKKRHKKAIQNQIVLNLDCVGDGDEIVLFPSKKLKKDRFKLTALYKACGYFGKKSVTVQEKGFSFFPSDQMHFPYGVGIGAFHRKKGLGIYCGRIHTPKDTILEETNINILRAALTTYLCCTQFNRKESET